MVQQLSTRRDELKCIVAAGGDGTVGDVMNRFPDTPIAILPLGTENLLARYLEIPPSGAALADIIAAGTTRRYDLGLAGNRRFILMASVGIDADVVHRLDAKRTGNITRFNYVQTIFESIRKYQYPELQLHFDEGIEPVTAKFAFMMNLPCYGFGLPIAKSAIGDDGQLDLRLFRSGSLFHLLKYSFNVFLRRHEQLADVQSIQSNRIRITSEVPAPIQIDGDPAGWTPVEIQLLPRALEVFVPSK